MEITDITTVYGEPEIKVNLFTAITKGEGFEYAIQKCIEAGVYSITPLITERTIVKIKTGKYNKKHERWNRIALETAKQSGRSIIPKVHKPMKFKEAIASINKDEPSAICYIEEGTLSLKRFLKENRKAQTFNILIGPEGGFTREEWEDAIDNKIASVSLGGRILKAETAGLFATAAIMYEFDQLDKKAEKQSKGE
jgi:16S rRNA (uracil1498-N3)-methyltransferase